MTRDTRRPTTGTWTPIPLDLLLVVAISVLTGLTVLVPGLSQTPLQAVLGGVFAVFAPGYVLVAVLFPRHRTQPDQQSRATRGNTSSGGLGWISRFVFSFGASLAIVTLLGIMLSMTPVGIQPVSLALGLSCLIAVLLPIAVHCRRQIPPDRRVDVSLSRTLRRWANGLLAPENTGNAVLNVALIVVLLLSSGIVLNSGQTQRAELTEFGLLSAGADGEYIATEYPSTLERGEPKRFRTQVTNLEGERVTYTVVVLLQQVDAASSTVVATSELDRFQETVGHNETWRADHSVVPNRTGENLRLRYLLYQGEPPQRPSAESAYRELHLWVNVTN